MKSGVSSSFLLVTISLVMCGCSATATLHGQRISTSGKNYTHMFESFKQDYKTRYTTAAEEAKRFRIFCQNMKSYETLNRLNPHAEFGVNEFADQSAEEFKVRHNAEQYYAKRREERRTFDEDFFARTKKKKSSLRSLDERKELVGEIGVPWPTPPPTTPAPSGAANMTVKDWRRFGAVTKVKDQGKCGSCWSFSTTGNIEGQWFLANHSLVSLSEQEFVSCGTQEYKLYGCRGGIMDGAFEWAASQGGEVTGEADLPYTSGGGFVPKCPQINQLPVRARIGGYTNIDPDESVMGQWVWANGPMAVSVDASTWMGYRSGILTHCAAGQIDHGVLLVGFDDNHEPPYWIIKNSWGSKWGEYGYLRIEKGTNQCTVTATPCSSQVDSIGPPRPATPPPPPGWGPPPGPPHGHSGLHIKTCASGGCADGCTTTVQPLGTCFQLNDGTGGSAQADCGSELQLYKYNNPTCFGSEEPRMYSLDQCIESPLNVGEWVEFSC